MRLYSLAITRLAHIKWNSSTDIKSRWKPLDLFEALPVILPPNTCQLFPWDRIVRCLQLPAAPRGARIVRFSFPRLRVGQESCDNSFPRLRVGQESRRETFPPPGRDKNRAAKPSRRLGETRIAPRNLPAARERQESRRETFPPPGRDKNRAAKPSRRSGETRIAPRNLPAVQERQESRRETLTPFRRDKNRAAKPSRRTI